MAKTQTYVRIAEDGTGRIFESAGLSDLQRGVARDGDSPGYIEGVSPQPGSPLPSNLQAYGHEEGRLIGYTENRVATKLLNWPYPLVGPVIVRATDKTLPVIRGFISNL